VIVGQEPLDVSIHIPTHCICIGSPIKKDGTVLQFLVYGGGFNSEWGVSYCIYRSTGDHNYTVVASTPKITLGPNGLHRIIVNMPVKAGDYYGFCNLDGQCDISTISKNRLETLKEYKENHHLKDPKHFTEKAKAVTEKAVNMVEKGIKIVGSAAGVNKVKAVIEVCQGAATIVKNVHERLSDRIENIEEFTKHLKQGNWAITTNSGTDFKVGTTLTLEKGKTGHHHYSVQVGMLTNDLLATYYQTAALPADSIIDSDVLYVKGDEVITLFQHTPTCLYITLPNTTDDDNFSSYMIPAAKPWGANDSNVYTRFSKIRFDPITMTVNTSDYTYAKSTGNCNHYKDQAITNTFPLGTAFDCEGAGSHTGKGNINLLETHFVIDDSFKYDGINAAGTFTFSNNNQVVNLTGGGNGGWICPSNCSDEKAAVKGGWVLKLKLKLEVKT